ncbi:hypothetical protein ACTM9U_06680 [Lachnospiraceae bacterium HCP1S3_B3]
MDIRKIRCPTGKMISDSQRTTTVTVITTVIQTVIIPQGHIVKHRLHSRVRQHMTKELPRQQKNRKK